MFIGHWAPALALANRPAGPRLASLFIAGQLMDWGFFLLVLLGAEHLRIVPHFTAMNPMDLYDMPLSHSLAGPLLLASGFAMWLQRSGMGRGGALIGALVVLSHWLLDLLAHAPDLTLAGGSSRFGLGLWNQPRLEMPLELGLVAAGLALYAWRARPAKGRLAALALLLLALQAVNWFGPPPAPGSGTTGMALTALAAYAMATAVARWVDRSASPAA
ncbi:MAG: hypothetical protein JSS36_11085 [Proteobacteria bacterium]|nr:hypothetical protein [Pseudomonadota bacterium]